MHQGLNDWSHGFYQEETENPLLELIGISRTRGDFLQHDGQTWKTKSKHIKWWKIKTFSPKIRNKKKVPILTSAVQHCTRSWTRKINKNHLYWKGKKLSPFTDVMILYLENSEESSRKPLEQINKFRKATGYRVNTQISVVFLYTYK